MTATAQNHAKATRTKRANEDRAFEMLPDQCGRVEAYRKAHGLPKPTDPAQLKLDTITIEEAMPGLIALLNLDVLRLQGDHTFPASRVHHRGYRKGDEIRACAANSDKSQRERYSKEGFRLWVAHYGSDAQLRELEEAA